MSTEIGGTNTLMKKVLQSHQPFQYDPPKAEVFNSVNKPETLDTVSAPFHYTQTKISAIEVIEDWGLGFNLGTVIKYIARRNHKGSALLDLEKAQWYLAREIWRMKQNG